MCNYRHKALVIYLKNRRERGRWLCDCQAWSKDVLRPRSGFCESSVCHKEGKDDMWSFQSLSSCGMGGRPPKFPWLKQDVISFTFSQNLAQRYCMGIIFIPSPISNSSCLLCTPNSWHLEQHIKIQPKSSTSWDAPFILLREDLKETAASQEGHPWISINVRNGWWNIDIPRGSKNRIASYPFYVCLSPAPHPDSLASAPSHPHPDKRGLESSNQFQECRKTTVPPINIEVNQAKASPRQRFFNFKCSVAFV